MIARVKMFEALLAELCRQHSARCMVAETLQHYIVSYMSLLSRGVQSGCARLWRCSKFVADKSGRQVA